MISVPFLTEPIFYFGDVEYSVDESAGYVEVRVWRTGTDLSKSSSVTVRSRKTDPPSADGEQFPDPLFRQFSMTMAQICLKLKYLTSIKAVWLGVLFLLKLLL